MKNAFSVKSPAKIKGRNILLVDDVFTTGATVDDCAVTLLQHGGAAVEIFTFARAEY